MTEVARAIAERRDTGEKTVLALNCGSSSLKVALFAVVSAEATGPAVTERVLARGAVEGIGAGGGKKTRMWLLPEGGERHEETRSIADHASALDALLESLRGANVLASRAPDAIGHRVVHGGNDHVAPTPIDDALLASLKRLVPFAPLHLPPEIAAMEAAARAFPKTPQVACFDTGFHRTLPPAARRLPIPASLDDAGVRRYGFHGISCEYVVESIGAATLGRAVIGHLGSGASMTAVKDGRSIDTTMGFTPTGGLVMSSRAGDLDPGVLVYMLNEKGYDAASLARFVDTESGLRAISGESSDMKTLLERRADDPRAALAVDVFCHSARKFVGALTAVLGGIDTLVFTGGIGEHAPPVRAQIARGLEHLGIHVDARKNTASDAIISPDAGAGAAPACVVRVVSTDEERMLARHSVRVLRCA